MIPRETKIGPASAGLILCGPSTILVQHGDVGRTHYPARALHSPVWPAGEKDKTRGATQQSRNGGKHDPTCDRDNAPTFSWVATCRQIILFERKDPSPIVLRTHDNPKNQ